jgi:hypothetical protein
LSAYHNSLVSLAFISHGRTINNACLG